MCRRAQLASGCAIPALLIGCAPRCAPADLATPVSTFSLRQVFRRQRVAVLAVRLPACASRRHGRYRGEQFVRSLRSALSQPGQHGVENSFNLGALVDTPHEHHLCAGVVRVRVPRHHGHAWPYIVQPLNDVSVCHSDLQAHPASGVWHRLRIGKRHAPFSLEDACRPCHLKWIHRVTPLVVLCKHKELHAPAQHNRVTAVVVPRRKGQNYRPGSTRPVPTILLIALLYRWTSAE